MKFWGDCKKVVDLFPSPILKNAGAELQLHLFRVQIYNYT